MCCEKCNKFTYAMNEFEKKEVTLCHNEMLKKAYSMLNNGAVQLIVLDDALEPDRHRRQDNLRRRAGDPLRHSGGNRHGHGWIY